ncbi:hypothetical protein CNX65_09365 [Actinosynnema pretiosum]|uniref:Tetratricopeptide repeat protein n=1 Tax=Actinosynnema pretiosum TaxID=42197 RepID=A0A290Z3A3_9PSEU|nr:hypothetical protein CNX65_09365 [Actinosynnema pretiosum]
MPVYGVWDSRPWRADLLNTFLVLDVPELPMRVLAVGSGIDLRRAGEELSAVLDRPLRDDCPARLSRVGGDRFRLHPEPVAPDEWDDAALLVARRIGEDLLRALAKVVPDVAGFDHECGTLALPEAEFADAAEAAAWPVRHRWLLLGAVRAAVKAGWHTLAAALAARMWVAASVEADPKWAEELAHWGAEAAIESRRPEALAGLLRLSAVWFADHGDFVTAEEHGVRELRARRRLGDPDGIADVLWRRAEVYRRWGRLHLALDCYRDLEFHYRELADERGAARVRAATGVVLLAAARPEAAVAQLERAARVLADLPGVGAGERAGVLEELGNALWRMGSGDKAVQRYRDALALLESGDDEAARRVRRLLERAERT